MKRLSTAKRRLKRLTRMPPLQKSSSNKRQQQQQQQWLTHNLMANHTNPYYLNPISIIKRRIYAHFLIRKEEKRGRSETCMHQACRLYTLFFGVTLYLYLLYIHINCQQQHNQKYKSKLTQHNACNSNKVVRRVKVD